VIPFRDFLFAGLKVSRDLSESALSLLGAAPLLLQPGTEQLALPGLGSNPGLEHCDLEPALLQLVPGRLIAADFLDLPLEVLGLQLLLQLGYVALEVPRPL
jgi:hypothetical protein